MRPKYIKGFHESVIMQHMLLEVNYIKYTYIRSPTYLVIVHYMEK